MKFSKVASSRNEGLQTGCGVKYLVQTPTGVLYLIGCDTNSDMIWCKSTDNGMTWTKPVVFYTGTVVSFSVWYDRWSGIAADLIHVSWQDSGVDDTFYRTLDASSDTLSNQVTVALGTSTAAGGCLSICRARGGNVYIASMIDAGAEGGFHRLLNANVPNGAWAARTTVFEAATQDQVILQPGFAADNQDIIALFLDASANELSRKVYDDSGNSWAETSIGTVVDSNSLMWAAAPDLTNNRLFVAAWNDFSTVPVPATADLVTWQVDETTITAKSNVVTNSGGLQSGCGVSITPDGAYWVTYYGEEDGSSPLGESEMFGKRSTDGGTTWDSEFRWFSQDINRLYGGNIFMCPRPYVSPPPGMTGTSDSTGNPTYGVVVPAPMRQSDLRMGFNG